MTNSTLFLRLSGLVSAAIVFSLCTMAVSSVAASETRDDQSDGGATLRVDVESAHFEGDFGSDETIRYDSLTTRLRWRWDHAEVRVSLPVLRLDGEAVLVGGAPTPSKGSGKGQAPPGQSAPSDPVTTIEHTTESGIGDMLVRADFDLVQGSARRPWLSGLAQVKLPTADESAGLGTGEVDVAAGLSLIQPLFGFNLFLEGRYNHLGDPPEFDLDDVIQGSLGVSRSVGASRSTSVYAFVENRTHPVPDEEDRRDVMLGAATRLGANKRYRISGAAFGGISSTAEDWGLQLLLGRQL